jgi:biopolymer transport protein ExbD
MPVKLGSRLPAPSDEARIEIIPLIDIMFFLLAAFMLVSLSMVHQRAVPVNLPTASSAQAESRDDFVNLTVDASGQTYLDRKPIGHQELILALGALRQSQSEPRVFISGDRDARHGDVIRVLDLVRMAGIQKVAFETREVPTGAGGGRP